MNYNLTNFTTSDNVLEMMVAVNSASGNWVSYGLLIGLFVILLISLLRNNPVQESFFASSTVSLVVSLLFLISGLINVVWVVGFTLIWALSMIALYKAT